jgi:hypothetical protein
VMKWWMKPTYPTKYMHKAWESKTKLWDILWFIINEVRQYFSHT